MGFRRAAVGLAMVVLPCVLLIAGYGRGRGRGEGCVDLDDGALPCLLGAGRAVLYHGFRGALRRHIIWR